jgi:hypothetical protein
MHVDRVRLQYEAATAEPNAVGEVLIAYLVLQEICKKSVSVQYS